MLRVSLFVLMTFMAFTLALPAFAAFDNPPPPPLDETIDNDSIALKYGDIKTVERGYILRTNEPSLTYKLAGIGVPEDESAQYYMEQLVKDTDSYPIKIIPLDNQSSRYGEPYAALVMEKSNTLIQEELVAAGLVRFFPYGLSFDSKLNAILQDAERMARSESKGLWADEDKIISAKNIDPRLQGQMVLVEGVIADSAVKDNYVYVNFDEDWKTDFTLMIPIETWEKLSEDDQLFLTTPTVKVLARGTLSSYYGPMIKINHPAQFEILP